MSYNPYLGHPQQIAGVEYFRREGGTGDGTRVCRIRNGQGLEVLLSPDRCADPSEVSFLGRNIGFLAPCGHCRPDKNAPFPETFSAGFMTTCGLENVGSPCVDRGEELPLHGTISKTPCHTFSGEQTEEGITVKATVFDSRLFGRMLKLEREYFFPFAENAMILTDRITNLSDTEAPVEILYHCNLGYPFLDEDTKFTVPAVKTVPRTEHARDGLADWSKAEKPQKGYEEMCFFHTLEGKTAVSAEQPKLKLGLKMEFDADDLPFFTQWKMMGHRQYVMGLEPGNCLPEGRSAQREDGTLTVLKPDEQVEYNLKFTFYHTED